MIARLYISAQTASGELKQLVQQQAEDLAALRSRDSGGNRSLVPSELREEIKDLQQQLVDAKNEAGVNDARAKHVCLSHTFNMNLVCQWLDAFKKLTREIARRAPQALSDDLPTNPLAVPSPHKAEQEFQEAMARFDRVPSSIESKTEQKDEDVLVSDTEEISSYSSPSQAQQAVPMEDDLTQPQNEVQITFADEKHQPKWQKSKTILMLKPAQPDLDCPVWLATFEGFMKGNKKCYVKYHQLVDGEFLPWHPDTCFEIHAKDPVLGTVDKLPKGEKQVRAFFETVQKH